MTRRLQFTATGKWLLFILALLYLASITSQSGLLLMLIGLLLGCYAVNLLQARAALQALVLEAPPSVHLAEREKLGHPWRLHNPGRGMAGLLEVASPAGRLFGISRLKPGETISHVPDFVFVRRGVYPLGQVTLASSYPFGLLRLARRLTLPGEMVVYPELYPVKPPPASAYDLMVGGKHRGARRTTFGTHFAGVRPLQPGDPLKQVHWKSSSKGQGLMVKTYDEELSGRVALILDAGHTGEAGTLDAAVRAAGSLLFAALDEGHNVEWLELGELERRVIPPFDDGHEMLDALARLAAHPGCLSRDRLERAIGAVSPRAALCLVLTAWTPAAAAVLEPLAGQGRLISVYLPEREPAPDVGGLHWGGYSEREMIRET